MEARIWEPQPNEPATNKITGKVYRLGIAITESKNAGGRKGCFAVIYNTEHPYSEWAWEDELREPTPEELALIPMPTDVIKVIQITFPNGDTCTVDRWEYVASAIEETWYGEEWVENSELGDSFSIVVDQMLRGEFDALEPYEP